MVNSSRLPPHLVEVALAADNGYVAFFQHRVSVGHDGLAVSYQFRHDKVEGQA